MGFSWLYYMSGVAILFSILIGIYLSVLLPDMPYVSNVLTNLLNFLQTLGDNGLVGLIVLIHLVGQYFLAYYLFNLFKEYRDNLQSS